MKQFNSLQLNEQQAEAVHSMDGALLIIAGAGSGKTRVITNRIAWLLGKGVPQSQILAVTFTNKAAREMAQRVKELIPRKLTQLTVCTFHAFGAQVLRERHSLLGYRANFSIYDSQDQATLLRETSRELGNKGAALDLVAAAQVISAVKTGRAAWGAENAAYQPLFKEYQRNLKVYNAVDFRRPSRASAAAPRIQPGSPRRVQREVPLPAGGRVPGHFDGPVRPDEAPRRPPRKCLRRGRRRPVDLLVAGRQLREHASLRAGLSPR